MKGLTKRQSDILGYIEKFIAEKKYSPSYREIMNHFAIKSSASIFKHIAALEKKEALIRTEYSSRSLALPLPITASSTEILLPLIGIVESGKPLELFSKTQTLSLPSTLITDVNSSYVLRIKGSGFFEEAMIDGDLIIVDTSSLPTDGKTVLAIVNRQSCLILRYFDEEERVRLESFSKKISPMHLPKQSIAVQGVITALIRSMG